MRTVELKDYADFRAPGTLAECPTAASERDRAVELARAVLVQSDDGDPLHLLARQLLRALGLSERG